MSVQALSCAMVVSGVSSSEKLLLLVLANYADERMTCFPSHRRMAADTCLTERTILSVLKSLETKRLISRRERKRADGSRATDFITLHFSGEVSSPAGAMISPCEEANGEGVGKPTAPAGVTISPLTTFEPPLEPSKEPTRRASQPASHFDAFWASYPAKVGKRAAEKAYGPAVKRAAGPDPHATILAGVERAKGSRKWREGIIPNPATFLNQDRWLDEPEGQIRLAPRAPAAPPTPELQRWRERKYRDTGVWPEDWGPRPKPSDDRSAA